MVYHWLVLILILSFFTPSLYGAETPVLTLEDEIQIEMQKIKLSPSDRMEIKLGRQLTGVGLAFSRKHLVIFKQIQIPFQVFPSEDQAHYYNAIILKFFQAVGNHPITEKLEKYFLISRRHIGEPGIAAERLNEEQIKKIYVEIDELFVQFIPIFNYAIAQNIEARNRIERVYREFFREKIAEKISKKREDNQRFIDESKPKNAFLYFLFGVGTSVQIPTAHHYGVEASYGVRFNYFFKYPASRFNYGIITNIAMVAPRGEGNTRDNSVSTGYLYADFLFALKFSFYNNVSNLLIAGGFSGCIKTGGNYSYTDYYGDIRRFEFPRFIPAFVLEIGYLLISKKQDFSLIFVFFAKIGFTRAVASFRNDIDQSDQAKYWSAGIRFGLGFNLN